MSIAKLNIESRFSSLSCHESINLFLMSKGIGHDPIKVNEAVGVGRGEMKLNDV